MIALRHLRAAEYGRFAEVWRHAYVLAPGDLARIRRRVRLAWTRGAFADGVLAAGLVDYPFRVFVGGRPMKMGGIAMVATEPEYRHQGLVRRLLERELVELRRHRVPLSFLYPFRFQYYRQFGWELCCVVQRARLEIAHHLPSARPGLRIVRGGPDDIGTLNRVYETFARRYNGMVIREARHWRNIIEGYDAGPNRVAICRDERRAAVGYCLFLVRATGERERTLEVRELVALTAPARASLLAYLGGHDSQARYLSCQMPADEPLLTELVEPRAELTLFPGFMGRIVDVEQAFAGRRVDLPEEVQFVLEVGDRLAPWNDGRFRIRVADQRTQVARVDAPPDFRCDVRHLTQAFLGFLGWQALADRGHIEVRTPGLVGAVERILPARPVFLNDFF